MPFTAEAWPHASAFFLALLFGLKHALDADHLAAVSTIVSARKGLWRSSVVGVAWGIGHTLALAVVAALVLLLRVQISPRLISALELAVAFVLVGIGIEALWKLYRGERLHVHVHTHADHVHWHPHFHATQTEAEGHMHHMARLTRRPLLIGMLHGLAGSAALMLIVVTQTSSPLFGLLYVLVFGIGSIGGMVLMSLLLSLPLQVAADRFARTHTAVRTLAACFSLAVGLLLMYEVGSVL